MHVTSYDSQISPSQAKPRASARLPSIGTQQTKTRPSSAEVLLTGGNRWAVTRAGGNDEHIGNHPGDSFAIRPRFPRKQRSSEGALTRRASEPASTHWTRSAATPTASPSWSSSDNEEHRSPHASLLSLALAAFHPSFPSHAETPSPSARRPSRIVAAKSLPSMRSAPSCAPPVCLVAARGRGASAAHLRLKMPRGL
ncbi:hypothetical protein T484DRAFT_1749478 [Baffinella frigidus]|nr:hypothetical protein T484DRAFT_1749478 [Cryptophyta sp. CCMP2293]